MRRSVPDRTPPHPQFLIQLPRRNLLCVGGVPPGGELGAPSFRGWTDARGMRHSSKLSKRAKYHRAKQGKHGNPMKRCIQSGAGPSCIHLPHMGASGPGGERTERSTLVGMNNKLSASKGRRRPSVVLSSSKILAQAQGTVQMA